MTFPIIALLLKSMNWSCLFMSLFNRGWLYYMQVCCILYFVCRISLSVIYIYLIVVIFLWYMFICLCGYGRPLDIAEENGCVLSVKDGELDIRSSISIPISVIDSGKVCFIFTFNVSFSQNIPSCHIFINSFNCSSWWRIFWIKIHCISAKLLEVLSGIANFRSKFRKLPLQLKCLEENIVESWGSMGSVYSNCLSSAYFGAK